MIELRIHGRGGQGAVVASKALAQAAFLKGHYVQSYPDYGVERRGAPVVAFARIAEPGDQYFVRQDIREPDHILVLDPTLLESGAPLQGLRDGGWVVVNSRGAPDDLDVPDRFNVATVDASSIAVEHGLGSASQPVVNTAILGAFARVTGIVGLDEVLEAIAHEVPMRAEDNAAAATEAYQAVMTRGAHA
ncbi:MAG: 2-oxoacid:acceptor oxidoreductase family protein [Actinobacteria bacterium]|jgi:2-oxoacid:acceptor oxidoreductase gamma subunit (pyruvate/2-ketoisovalerate family)|nr:2-oxoacid:acceptor oxidoreductase family protein [Actinomycetota bacterium]